MIAIANGISLHGGFLPYISTVLMFVEYAHNAVRMAALMKERQVMVYTHDSIGLGEDGPTTLILSRQNLAQQERTEEQLTQAKALL